MRRKWETRFLLGCWLGVVVYVILFLGAPFADGAQITVANESSSTKTFYLQHNSGDQPYIMLTVPSGDTRTAEIPNDPNGEYNMGIAGVDSVGPHLDPDKDYHFAIWIKTDGSWQFAALDGFVRIPLASAPVTPDFGTIPSTVEVPALGEVTLPDWAVSSPYLAMFFMGIASAAGIKLVRAALRWFKRADGVPTE